MTERQTKILEVGDVIYEYRHYGSLTKYLVTRVTPKMAFAKYSEYGNNVGYRILKINRRIIRQIGFPAIPFKNPIVSHFSSGHLNTEYFFKGRELKFKRELSDTSCGFKEIGDSGYGSSTYYVETPKLKAKYERQQLERMFSEIKVSELNNEQLTEILKIAGKVVA